MFHRSILHRLAHRGRHQRHAAVGTLVAGALAAGVLTGCTIGDPHAADSGSQNGAAASSSEAPPNPAGSIKASVRNGEKQAPVKDLFTVTAEEKLTSVTLTNDADQPVEGSFNADRTQWTAKEKLGYDRSYKLVAKSADHKLASSFSTVSPTAQTWGALSPLDGSVVGVGQSIAIRFDSVIEDRKAAQDAITVKTSPEVQGAFYWISSQEVRWRPQKYWAPGTKVTVKADLYGAQLGDGVYGGADRTASFTIGDDVRAVVDNNTKQMTVTKNGKKLKTMPVSTGMDGGRWATPNGVYQVGDKAEQMTMDSTTYGFSLAEGGYRTQVQYATQMSYSGIYIHAAPWSEWAQGSENTSHGCINVSTSDAQWVYNTMKRGDIVEVKNTTGPKFSGYDGLGDWNIDWKTWSAGNTKG